MRRRANELSATRPIDRAAVTATMPGSDVTSALARNSASRVALPATKCALTAAEQMVAAVTAVRVGTSPAADRITAYHRGTMATAPERSRGLPPAVVDLAATRLGQIALATAVALPAMQLAGPPRSRRRPAPAIDAGQPAGAARRRAGIGGDLRGAALPPVVAVDAAAPGSGVAGGRSRSRSPWSRPRGPRRPRAPRSGSRPSDRGSADRRAASCPTARSGRWWRRSPRRRPGRLPTPSTPRAGWPPSRATCGCCGRCSTTRMAGLAYFMAPAVESAGERTEASDDLGGYHLESRIGEGGMGEVWKATPQAAGARRRGEAHPPGRRRPAEPGGRHGGGAVQARGQHASRSCSRRTPSTCTTSASRTTAASTT